MKLNLNKVLGGKILRMRRTTYPCKRGVSDTASLRGLTKLSILIRVSVEIHEFPGSFSALTLCIKKN